MICELCGIKTQLNWGDGETVLCEPCSNSDQGKEIRIRRQNSIAKTIAVAVINPNEYGASAQDKSYFRGPLLWWASKVWAVLAVVLFVIVVTLIAIPQFATMRRRGPDDWVKTNIRNAARSQESYFVDHETYTSNIDSLKGYGYLQSSNVIISAEATATTFIITGTVKKGCEAKTGV